MKKKVKQKKENSERWLLTYADMITLLLALFIVLYAISNVDQSKYHQLAEALNQSLGDGNGLSVFDGKAGVLDNNGNTIKENNSPSTPAPTGGAGTTLTTKEDMKNLAKGVNSILDNLHMTDASGTVITDRGLTVTFSNDVFFDSGKADLKDDLKKGLAQISVLLNRVDNPIVVEGYTDNIPISAQNLYSSNWLLSAARAANVVEFLVDEEKMNGNRVAAAGYGEYHPKASNSTDDGRKKNRRVELTVLYSTAKGLRPTNTAIQE